MKVTSAWWLLVGGVVVTGCSTADTPPPVEVVQRAVATDIVYLHRGDYWQVSATFGDRGTAWRDGMSPLDDGWEWKQMPIGYGEDYVTPISYGADPAHKPTTVYLRKTFNVNDPTKATGLRMDALYDDGFVAYLNGQEILRAHMPAGEPTYSTLSPGYETGNHYVSFDVSAARSLLVRGNNRLTVEVHQNSPSSSDLTFDGSLVAVEDVAPPVATTDYITQYSVWSYWDKGDPDPAWRTAAYDVSGWRYGPGPLGYGENYLNTVVGYGGDPAHKHLVTSFRRPFLVNQPDSVSTIIADIMYDDGFEVYLNGRHAFGVPATGHEGNNAYEVFDLSAYRGLLVPGVNIVAVEVHQANATSSDLVFDLDMYFGYQPPPAVYAQTIEHGSTWSYFDGGGNLGTTWRMPGYNDAAWHTGAGPLGYGESYLNTTVSYGANAAQKPVTTYFRKKFNVDLAHGDAVSSVFMDMMYDDGAVVYLNGNELVRPGMGSGEEGGVGAGDLAQGHEANNTYAGWNLAANSQIVDGENVLAVEVHQVTRDSSDLVFDLGLRVETAPKFTRRSSDPVVPPPGPNDGVVRWYSHPSVVRVPDGSWVMFYTGGDGQHANISRATSADGVSWTLDAQPVIDVGDNPSALFDGGQFRLWHGRLGASGLWYKESADGIHWSGSSEPVFGTAREASVIKDGATYRIWYHGGNGIGYATSSDGLAWSHHPSLVMNDIFRVNVIRDGDQFKMWFPEEFGMRYATSSDGIHWFRHGLSMPRGDLGTWDQQLGSPSVVRDGGVLKMWYAGPAAIGYATTGP